ncbi:hypothetical protein E2562_029326 [Oryza meyeriana var. granulata]|uniref:Uncharacterized protein n=1 Tax=Oryza meyeriana var. granulata TaxID=110450 RepID=A0A6G1E3N3_9ORYZ|nr:hypothetical protein E2562_029326 [Oryza meyeriana var. granulata]
MGRCGLKRSGPMHQRLLVHGLGAPWLSGKEWGRARVLARVRLMAHGPGQTGLHVSGEATETACTARQRSLSERGHTSVSIGRDMARLGSAKLGALPSSTAGGGAW